MLYCDNDGIYSHIHFESDWYICDKSGVDEKGIHSVCHYLCDCMDGYQKHIHVEQKNEIFYFVFYHSDVYHNRSVYYISCGFSTSFADFICGTLFL